MLRVVFGFVLGLARFRNCSGTILGSGLGVVLEIGLGAISVTGLGTSLGVDSGAEQFRILF